MLLLGFYLSCGKSVVKYRFIEFFDYNFLRYLHFVFWLGVTFPLVALEIILVQYDLFGDDLCKIVAYRLFTNRPTKPLKHNQSHNHLQLSLESVKSMKSKLRMRTLGWDHTFTISVVRGLR